jgi:uncharacterized RDD family membrane protein YckC
MNCEYCASWNAEDEHRCTRCGRRLKVTGTSAAGYPASRSAAAFALAREPAVVVEVEEPTPLLRASVPQKLPFHDFADSKVIPFESFAAHRIEPLVFAAAPARTATAPSAPAATPAPAIRQKASRPLAAPEKNDVQPALDFLLPAPQGPRTLKTKVEAVIYCDANVATPKHRAIAAAIDGGMIFIGFSLFLFAFHLMGGMFRFNRQTIPFFVGAFGTLAMFYGLLWIWADRQTVGMRWTGLRLIDFDGFPADRRARSLRAIGACLSLCAGGLGLLWALADEEKLAWHDHMSKTFPTLEESNRSFFQKRL